MGFRLPLEFIEVVFGGPKEDRTPDLRIANAALSQLSYRPVGNESTRTPQALSIGGLTRVFHARIAFHADNARRVQRPCGHFALVAQPVGQHVPYGAAPRLAGFG